MLHKDVRKNLALYQGQQVLVKLYNGKTQRGTMFLVKKGYDIILEPKLEQKEMDSTEEISSIVIDGTEYALEDISDIRYVGRVTRYYTSTATAVIDNYFTSTTVEDDALYEKLKFKEFDCLVSCHLFLDIGSGSELDADTEASNVAAENNTDENNPESGISVKKDETVKIYATDMCLVEAKHRIHKALLNVPYLYKFSGVWNSGILKLEASAAKEEREYNVILENGKAVAAELIEDIMCMPVQNKKVEVRLKNAKEQTFTGIVSMVNREGFCIVTYEKNQIKYKYAAFAELEELYFYGKITKLDKYDGIIDEEYDFKKAYVFSENVDKKEYAMGTKVTYVSGVAEDGLIAKQIYVHGIKQDWQYGLFNPISAQKKEQNWRFISERFVRIQGYCELKPPAASYLKDKLKDTLTDQLSLIYVARYTVEGAGRNGMHYAGILGVEKKIRWDRAAVYAEIDTKTGKVVQKNVYQTPKGLEWYIDKEVDLTYIGADGTEEMVSGKLWYNRDMFEKLSEEEWSVSILRKTKEDVDVYVRDITDMVIYEKMRLTMDRTEQGMYFIHGREVAFHINDNPKVDQNAINYKKEEWISYRLGVNSKIRKLEAYDVCLLKKEVMVVSFDDEDNCLVLDKEKYEMAQFNTALYNEVELKKLENNTKKELDINKVYSAHVIVGRELGEEYCEEKIIVRPFEYRDKKHYIGKIDWFRTDTNPKHGYIIPWQYLSLSASERKAGKLNLSFNTVELFDGETLDDLDTMKYTYNVVYNKAYSEYSKKYVASDVRVISKKMKKNTTVEQEAANVLDETSIVVHKMQPGETFGYVEDERICYTNFVEYVENDGFVLGSNGVKLSKEQVQRFGLVTGYDFAENIGYLDDYVEFSLSVMEDTSYKALKTDKTTMLLCYTCDSEDKIESAWRALKIETLLWEKGRIVNFEKKTNKKVLTVELDDGRTGQCYMHGSIDNVVNGKLKNAQETWYNEPVYVKTVSIYNQDKQELETIIAEVRLEREEHVVKLKKISEQDDTMGYFSYRKGTTVSYPLLKESKKYLASLLGKNVMVCFAPDEKEGTELFARIEGNLQIPLSKSAYVLCNEKYKGMNEETLKEELEARLHEMLQNTGAYESRGFRDAEYSYLLGTLQAAYLEDKKYLYNLFLSLHYGVEELNETIKDEKMDADVCAEQLKELFGRISWQTRTISNLFLEKLMLLDNYSFDWLVECIALWNMDSMLSSIISSPMLNEINSVKEIKEDNSLETKDKAILMLQEGKAACDMKKDNWLEGLQEADEGNVLKKLESYHESVTNMALDWAEWNLVKQEERKCIEQFVDEASKISNEHEAARLREIGETIKGLAAEARNYPMQILSEVFLGNKIPEILLRSIDVALGEQYMEPNLVFSLLEEEFYTGQREIAFYLYNGAKDDFGDKVYKTIERGSVLVKLCHEKEENGETVITELVSKKYSFDKLSQYTKEKLECYCATLDLNDAQRSQLEEYPAESQFVVKVSATITSDGKEKEIKNVPVEKAVLRLCGQEEKQPKDNPYNVDRELESGSDMFFGRAEEKEFISKRLTKNENGEISINLEPVYIYGQKRTGKSCVVRQLISKTNKLIRVVEKKNESGIAQLETEELENTVIVKFSTPETMKILVTKEGIKEELLKMEPEERKEELAGRTAEEYCDYVINQRVNAFYDDFLFKLYSSIIEELLNACMLRKELEDFYYEHRDDVYEIDSQNYEKFFEDFLAEFHEFSGRKMSIICALDEFTGYCESVVAMKDKLLKEKAFGFLEKFQKLQITLIIIGHELMFDLIDQMDAVNKTMGRSKGVKQIDELKENDAIMLIVEPFRRGYGYNPFESLCGERVINELLQLSGRNPYILSNLCWLLYDYLDKKTGKLLTEKDLEICLKTTVLNPEEVGNYRQWFDSFLGEKHENDSFKKDLRKYLRAVSKNNGVERGMVLSNLRDLDTNWTQYAIDEFEDLLRKRKIIEIADGKIWVKVQLLRRYLLLSKE